MALVSATIEPAAVEMARSTGGDGPAAGVLEGMLAGAQGFSVGKPAKLKESNPNTNEVALAAFVQGASPGELSCDYEAISGASPVSVNGQQVATLFFRSESRRRYHLFAQLVANQDGAVLAQFERKAAAGLVQIGWGSDITIAAPPGQPYAAMSSSPSGTFTHTDGSGGLNFNKLGFCAQPACKWCVISCLCCVPTLSIATCIACTKMQSAPVLFNVSSSNGGEEQQIAFREVNAFQTHGDFSFGSQLDGSGKIDLLLLVCARVASGCCHPQTSNNDNDTDYSSVI